MPTVNLLGQDSTTQDQMTFADKATGAEALRHLRKALGDNAATFRDGQLEAIIALVNHSKRLLVVQRTGWGKSLVYFIATRILRDRRRGPTLIVSPLLALMRNQIEAAERIPVSASTINSSNTEQWPEVHRAIEEGTVDTLLISPERLANDDFVENVLIPNAANVGLLVIDEAHCISDWGHDFRPDYRRIVSVLRNIPSNVPIIGTTATANDRVVNDVRTQLGDIEIQRGGLIRETLELQTIRLPTQAERLAWLAEYIHELPGTGIIYALTKRDAEQVASWLTEQRVDARAYYSGATCEGFENSTAYRQDLEAKLLGNEIKALVATTALGMGYDKPDLGFVVHYQAPGSVVAYYQQVGRAGRGIERAIGILMSGDEDSEIHEYFRRTAFPKENWVSAVLTALDESDGLSIREMESAVNLRQGQIEQVLKYLSVANPAPVLKQGSKWHRTPVAYSLDRKNIERLTGQRLQEWQEVQRFLDEQGCLMEFLARALDDKDPRPCGRCANCLGEESVVGKTFKQSTAISAARFLRQSELPLKCNKQVPKDAFQNYEFRGTIPGELRANTGRILSRWGDAGWGRIVAEDKEAGRFRHELVAATVELINDRWQPNPPPAWVTCVPSLSNRHLVPGFASRRC